MASGVTIDDEVITAYESLKGCKKHHYLIFNIYAKYKRIGLCDKSERVSFADQKANYEEFLDKLDAAADSKQARYAVYDFIFVDSNGIEKSKIFFVLWNPDNASVKEKMLYASSSASLKDALKEGKGFQQCNDRDDISYDKMMASLKSSDRA